MADIFTETEFTFKPNGLKIIKTCFQDLNKLNTMLKWTINKDYCMLYTIIGEKGDIRGFKCFRFKTEEILENFTFDKQIQLYIPILKNWISGIAFLETDQPIKMVWKHTKDNNYCYNVKISDQQLTLSFIADSPELIVPISWDDVIAKLANSKSMFSVNVEGNLLNKSKKLIKNAEDKDVLNMNVDLKESSVQFNTSAWDLTIGKLLESSKDVETLNQFYFKAKYLNCISSEVDNLKMTVYSDKIVINDNSAMPSLYMFPLDLHDV